MESVEEHDLGSRYGRSCAKLARQLQREKLDAHGYMVAGCGRAVTPLIQRGGRFNVGPSSKYRLPFSNNRVCIYIHLSFESYLNICQVSVQPSTFNLLDRLIVTRQREREKKEASRVYEPCIIESHSRCMAAGLMQGSLFPRWPIHSPRDLGACMPCTYQRLLHDRSYYVSK